MNIFANFNDSESILRALALVRKVQKKNPSCTHVGIRHDPAIELLEPNAPKGHKDKPVKTMNDQEKELTQEQADKLNAYCEEHKLIQWPFNMKQEGEVFENFRRAAIEKGLTIVVDLPEEIVNSVVS